MLNSGGTFENIIGGNGNDTLLGNAKTQGMRSSTLWTTAYDTKNKVLYHHTQHNRRVRKVDLNEIDFDASGKLMQLPLDKEKVQNIEDVTPRK